MAVRSGIGQRYCLEGYDLTGDVGAMEEFNLIHDVIAATSIDKQAMVRLAGHVAGAHRFQHFFNDADNQVLEAVGQHVATNRVALWVLSGATPAIGDPAFGMVIKQVQSQWTRGSDGSYTGSTGGPTADFPVEDCIMLTSGQDTHASASSNASYDNGAQATAGAVCYIQFQERDSGTPTFVFEDSANDSTWGTLLSMTTTGGTAPHAERATVTGTVERYLRITTTGTFVNADFYAAIRVGTANDVLDLS